MAESIYQKYDGFSGVTSIVKIFYQKVRKEEKLAKYFSKVRWELLMEYQAKFLSKVLGGPDNYEGRSLQEAHQSLNITKDDFVLLGGLMQESLEEAGIEASDVTTIMGLIFSVKEQIIR